jgi:hypothetical protein
MSISDEFLSLELSMLLQTLLILADDGLHVLLPNMK